jgi:hypothetical protein
VDAAGITATFVPNVQRASQSGLYNSVFSAHVKQIAFRILSNWNYRSVAAESSHSFYGQVALGFQPVARRVCLITQRLFINMHHDLIVIRATGFL